MEILGSHTVAAGRARVWDALNDPDILRRSVPGCESVRCERAGEFEVVLALQVGPFKARFGGTLQMEDVRPGEGCVLRFRGQGGAMGFAKGSAKVELRDAGAQTVIDYAAEAQVGGKLAQVGSRMIESVARRTSEQFFAAFQQALSAPASEAPAAAAAAATASPVAHAASPARGTGPWTVPAWWLLPAGALGAAAALAGVVLGR
jgi:carbon monoxide dehydrogenase subunit G